VVSQAAALPELQDLSICKACGQRIGWVTVMPAASKRPVDTEPRPLAEYALLRNGRTAVNLRDASVDEVFEKYDGPRFWDHDKACPVPSMRTAAAGLGLVLRDLGGVKPNSFKQEREARRSALLRADRERN
jgi:hypothetical protein